MVKCFFGKIYFEKNLPKNCGECPFNYDGIRCEALDYDERPRELALCLDSRYGTVIAEAIRDRRYSKCPLREVKNERKRQNQSNNTTKKARRV